MNKTYVCYEVLLNHMCHFDFNMVHSYLTESQIESIDTWKHLYSLGELLFKDTKTNEANFSF